MEQAVTSDTGPGSGLRLVLNSPEIGRVEGSLGGSGGGCSVTFINQSLTSRSGDQVLGVTLCGGGWVSRVSCVTCPVSRDKEVGTQHRVSSQ